MIRKRSGRSVPAGHRFCRNCAMLFQNHYKSCPRCNPGALNGVSGRANGSNPQPENGKRKLTDMKLHKGLLIFVGEFGDLFFAQVINRQNKLFHTTPDFCDCDTAIQAGRNFIDGMGEK